MRIKIHWLFLPVGAACGAALYFLQKRRKSESALPSDQTVPAEPAVPKAPLEASYSFISGFQDAATVDMQFSYDSEHFRYTVAEEDFLAETGDSHVGILHGEAFSVQFEYGTYYPGEDFARLRAELASKHRDLSDVSYGGLTGISYRAGDHICLAFPIPEDANSYLLVTLVKAPDNDDEPEALPADPELQYILGSVSFVRR